MMSEPEITTFRPDRPGIRKVLGDLEAEIMEFVWSRPTGQGSSVREVFEVLYERRRIAYTTVMNTMTRLAKKNYLSVEKQDQAYIYYPVLSQQAFVSRFVERILENLFVNFAGPTRDGIKALRDSGASEQASQLLEEITRRREVEER